MKLIRFGAFGAEKPGVQLEDGSRIDVSSIVSDYTPEFFAEGGLDKLAAADLSSCPAISSDERLGAVVKRPGKMICVGLNFKDHAEEGGMEVPAEPVIFFKASSALVGPNDDLVIPRGSEKTDWEVELAIVIGKKASYVKVKRMLLIMLVAMFFTTTILNALINSNVAVNGLKVKAATLSHHSVLSLLQLMKSQTLTTSKCG